MRRLFSTEILAFVTAIALTITPAGAGGLLGSVTKTVGSTVDAITGGSGGGDGGGGSGGGGGGSGSVADIGSGSAGSSSLINIGVGSNESSPDNVVDIKLGGSSAGARVTGNGNGVQVEAGALGSNLVAGLNLNALGINANVPGVIDILGGGSTTNQQAGGRVRIGSTDKSFQVACSVKDGRKVLELATKLRPNPKAWAKAANIQVVQMRLCPQARKQVAQIFAASAKIRSLHVAVQKDGLIVASLSRTRHSVRDVFAVQAGGGRLIVYVY